MLSLTIAGGIFLLDYKIKEHIDSTRLQGSKEEVLGGRLLLRNCHNKDKILGKVKIGRENCQELAAAGMDPWATPKAYNNMKDFFETGVSWSNNVNVAQKFDKGNYSFSMGNTTTNGIVPSTGMDRYNVKLSAEAQLHPNWTPGFNGNFVTSKITKQSTANTSVVATVYNAPVSYNMAGIPSHIEGDLYTQNTYRSDWIDDAYWAVDNNQFSERSQRFFGNAFVKYSTKFGTDNHKLDIKYQIGDDAYTTNYSEIYGYGSTWAATGEDSEYHYTVNELNSLLTASYTWNINDEWALDALIGNEFVDKKTKFCLDFPKGERKAARGDEFAMRQILMNLLTNAVKFTPEGGTVTVRLRKVPIVCGKVRYVFDIEDTGVGISSEFQKRIFEPYAQENHKVGGRGVGLGLAIVKEYVDQLGGSIRIKSSLGQGTCFTCIIPLDKGESCETEETEKTFVPVDVRTNLRGMKVLLAEDDPISRDVMRRIVGEWGGFGGCR